MVTKMRKCGAVYKPEHGAVVCILFENEYGQANWLVVRVALANDAMKRWSKGEGADVAPHVAGFPNGRPRSAGYPAPLPTYH